MYLDRELRATASLRERRITLNTYGNKIEKRECVRIVDRMVSGTRSLWLEWDTQCMMSQYIDKRTGTGKLGRISF